MNYAWNLFAMAIVWWCTDWICDFVTGNVIVEMLLKLLICLVVPNVLLLFIYFRTPEYKQLQALVITMIKKIVSKRHSS